MAIVDVPEVAVLLSKSALTFKLGPEPGVGPG
jgi:hypothetical protein